MAISMRTYKVKVDIATDDPAKIQDIRSIVWAELSWKPTRTDRPHGTITWGTDKVTASLSYETDNPNTAIRVMGYVRDSAEYRGCKVIGVSCEDVPKKWFSD